MSNPCDYLIYNVQIATMLTGSAPYGEIKNGCIAIDGERIVYVGELSNFSGNAKSKFDGGGKWILPGFIDCHTHLVYGGDRANEFERRLNGESYQSIAAKGGGIKSTVNATRKATADELLASAILRATALVNEGVTTLEVKSGYGLDLDTEIKMLQVAKKLSDELPVNILATYLGAHALPAEFAQDADAYIDFVCDEVMPKISELKLADSVDVFCESIGFSPAQCERVFKAAQQFGLTIKAHVEQLSDLKGAKLACDYHALSVDHIEYLPASDVFNLKLSDTVAVLLPGAFYFLNETQKPPIEALRKQQVPMAIATDLNPGSSPIASILTCANMTCVLFALTPEEALRGITVNAAKALGLKDRGEIKAGCRADLCLWDISHPAQLVYTVNQYKPVSKWFGGKLV
ncbi:imidazolonepropionase [Aliiglaciecola sp. 2_MG-2023]|uniref:imidazolonepropionase n=1 Tax=unclassified Aliiglaciecola TaxID=2593648 RepID=UPI0026E3B1DC|nr:MULTISPECIES: imidazolonepropionase [unclassified Aliiglaciecola]MDO6710601.1 imidazolonepropionase [Aliiglaciecola sp. 2_MG-2023]MDO6751534.1 imidazolonepropionase [Aliiglaciecola sp. 1_MG-2023]